MRYTQKYLEEKNSEQLDEIPSLLGVVGGALATKALGAGLGGVAGAMGAALSHPFDYTKNQMRWSGKSGFGKGAKLGQSTTDKTIQNVIDRTREGLLGGESTRKGEAHKRNINQVFTRAGQRAPFRTP